MNCRANEDPLAGLSELLLATRPGAEVETIRRAYDLAAYWHQGQTRRSGDPFITHPLAVATILAGLGADDQVLCAAMLHDTIVDTPCTLGELSREFGSEVAGLVAGNAAIDKARSRRRRTVVRAMAAAAAADARILAIKVADRLHNMRTIQFLPQAKQLRKARESLDIFIPVAAQLRLDAIKSELATLASATLARNRYARSASARLITATTALLPAASRTRWSEEWIGELHSLPRRHSRVSFAAHTLLGVPRLAWTLHKTAACSGRAR